MADPGDARGVSPDPSLKLRNMVTQIAYEICAYQSLRPVLYRYLCREWASLLCIVYLQILLCFESWRRAPELGLLLEERQHALAPAVWCRRRQSLRWRECISHGVHSIGGVFAGASLVACHVAPHGRHTIVVCWPPHRPKERGAPSSEALCVCMSDVR